MKKFKKLFIIVSFSAFIISGFTSADTKPAPLCQVVTQVDISCRKEHMLISRHYTDMKKMEAVLLYLRLLDPQWQPGSSTTPLNKDVYAITVHLSDGRQRVYRQKAHRYFSRDSGSWKIIDPEKASRLYALMRHLPSDAVFNYKTSSSPAPDFV